MVQLPNLSSYGSLSSYEKSRGLLALQSMELDKIVAIFGLYILQP